MGRHEIPREAIEARLVSPDPTIETAQPAASAPVIPVVGRGAFEPRRYLRPAHETTSTPINQLGTLSRLRVAPYIRFQTLAKQESSDIS